MLTLRKWATPLTIGAFLVMGVTGSLMFFHANTGMNKIVHEWIGLVLVAGVIAHLVVNFRPLKAYLKRPLALGIIGTGAVVLALSFLPASVEEGPGGADGMQSAMRALNTAPIATLADLTGDSETALLERLEAAGYEAASTQTLAEIAGGDRALEAELMSLVFSSPEAS